MRAYKTVAAAAMGLALVACGGGGGGGSDDAPAGPQAANGDFTTGSYQADADRALEPLLLAFEFDTTLGTAVPFAGGEGRARAAAATAGTSLAGATLHAARFERSLFETLLSRRGRVQAQATDTDTFMCSGGGSLHLTITYANAEVFTPGDRIDVSSNGCIEDGQTIVGTLGIVLSQFSEGETSFSAKARLEADGFGSAALRLDGTAQLALSGTANATSGRVTIAYTGMAVEAGADRFVWDHSYTFTYTETGETLALDGYAAVDGRYYDIRQDQPFALNESGVLTSGRVSLLDRDGDRVQIDATTGGGSTYTLFAAGSSTPLNGPVTGLPLGN